MLKKFEGTGRGFRGNCKEILEKYSEILGYFAEILEV